MTLTEFLLARYDDAEAAARSCPPWPWRVATAEDQDVVDDVYAGETVVAADGFPVSDPFSLSGPQTRAVRDHIARHDPAWVLAECDVKRRIVALHAADADFSESCAMCGTADEFPEHWPCGTLLALAHPYADHPDYQDEWRV